MVPPLALLSLPNGPQLAHDELATLVEDEEPDRERDRNNPVEDRHRGRQEQVLNAVAWRAGRQWGCMGERGGGAHSVTKMAMASAMTIPRKSCGVCVLVGGMERGERGRGRGRGRED